MALTSITPAKAMSRFTSDELEVYSWGDDLYAQVINNQCNFVNAYVNSSPLGLARIKMGVCKVPDECEAVCLSLIRYSLLSQLPSDEVEKSTSSNARQREYDTALAFLEQVAKGLVEIDYQADDDTEASTSSLVFGGAEKLDFSVL